MITRPSLCGRFARLTLKLLCLLLLNSILITNVACSSRASTIAKQNADADTTSDEMSDDATTTTTKTNPTSTSTTKGTDKLFDTDLDDSEQPVNAKVSNYQRPSSTEQSCLANGFNNYEASDQEDDRYSSRNRAACLSPQQTGARVPLSQNTLYDAGVQTYSLMNKCLELVLQRQPRTGEDAAFAHVAGRMALIRCYQSEVVGGMRRNLPWGNEALQSFQVQDNNLRVLLLQLSRYCQTNNCN